MLDQIILTLGKNQVNGLELIISLFMFCIALLCMIGAVTVVLYTFACLGFSMATISFQRRKEARVAYAHMFGGFDNAEN